MAITALYFIYKLSRSQA